MSMTYPTVAEFIRDTTATDGKAVRANKHPVIVANIIKANKQKCGHAIKSAVHTQEKSGNAAEVKTVLAKQKKQEQGFDQLAVALAGLEVSNA